MCEQNTSYVAKYAKQNLRENYSKTTEIAVTACKISKFFRENMPPYLPRAVLVSQSASNLFCQKNTLEINVEIMAHSFKISRYCFFIL